MQILVDEGVRINPELCDCEKGKRPCTRAILDSTFEPFSVRKVSAEQDLYSWDLAQFRYPRRQSFDNLRTVNKMKWIDLNFDTVARE